MWRCSERLVRGCGRLVWGAMLEGGGSDGRAKGMGNMTGGGWIYGSEELWIEGNAVVMAGGRRTGLLRSGKQD